MKTDETLLDMRQRQDDDNDGYEDEVVMDAHYGQTNTPTTLRPIPPANTEIDEDNRKTDGVPVVEDVGVTTELNLTANRFQILNKLGEGAMATVYRARDMRFAGDRRDAVVALKILSHDHPWGDQAEARIKNEAYFQRTINSRHVAQVYDLLPLPDARWAITQELIEGRTLAEIIRSGERIDWPRLAKWGAQIASGLHAAHKEGVVHRDLKPENIMIRDSDDSAVIVDFGVAKLFGPNETCLTQQGNIVGTFLYMAPEQLRKRTHRTSDLYALGLCLVRLVTGDVPRSGDRSLDSIVFERVLEPKPFRLRDHAPDAPPEIADIIDRLLESHPSDRIQTGAEVAEAFEDYLDIPFARTRIMQVADFVDQPTVQLLTPPRTPRSPPPPPPPSRVFSVVPVRAPSPAAPETPRAVTPAPAERRVPLLAFVIAAILLTISILFASLAQAKGRAEGDRARARRGRRVLPSNPQPAQGAQLNLQEVL